MKTVTVELTIDQYALEQYVNYLEEDINNSAGIALAKEVHSESVNYLLPPEGAVEYAYELLSAINEQARTQ